MAKKRTSIHDIARQLDVSVSSVSRALNDHPSISAALKDRVRQVAAALHYTPNPVAVNLKTGRRNIIGIVVPNINRNFFSSVIEGIEDIACHTGYDVLICQSKDSGERERRIVGALLGKVDGVIASIAADADDHSHYNQLAEAGIPLVLFDRTACDVEAGTVIGDDLHGAAMAVNHLLKQGLRRIYHFGGPDNVSVWRNRKEGYLHALNRAGIGPQSDWIFQGRSTAREEGRQAARQLLERRNAGEPLPEAVFCAGDFMALGAMLEFQAAGIRIPDDIAIVGYANEPFDALLPTPLSSVEQFSYKMGCMAGEMLFERLRGEPRADIVITPELIVRRSSSIRTNK